MMIKKFVIPRTARRSRYFSTVKYSDAKYDRCPRRALLYLPSSKERFIEKAATQIHSDCICLDLEDGVAINAKQTARNNIVESLSKYKFSSEVLVRINPLGSGFEDDDIHTVLSGTHLPDSILLPKVESAEHIQWLAHMIDHYRHLWTNRYDKIAKPITITALIESGRAISNLKHIVDSHTLLDCMIFGADDFAHSIGATRTPQLNNTEVMMARQSVVVHASERNIQCIDMVFIDYQDDEGLKRESLEGANIGYSGKQVIHPRQLQIVQESFSPSPSQIKWATDIVSAHDQHQEHGTGAFSFNGAMIDMPTVKIAEKLLARAKGCGLV